MSHLLPTFLTCVDYSRQPNYAGYFELLKQAFGCATTHGETYPGVLGNFQVAITYHADNANGIPHAHVIVNSTDMDKLTRMRINQKQYKTCTARPRGWHKREAGSTSP